MNKMIVVEPKRCMSCHSCELACAVAHSESKDLVKAIREKNKPFPNIILEKIEEMVIPIHCRHCEDAPCVTVCPSGAIFRPDKNSPVLLDQSKCIGCHACILVCPFGVIRVGPDGKSLIKCGLCFERLKQGQEPACVEACITGAIKYANIEEISRKKREDYVKKYKVAIMKGEEIVD